MSRLVLILVLGLAAVGTAFGQTLDEYLKLRKQYGIQQSAGAAALETLVGTRVLEVKGVVKGSIQTEDGTLLLLKSDSGSLTIDVDKLPDWLSGNEVPARLIVRATRATEGAALEAKLLGAAADYQIKSIEEKLKKTVAKAVKRPAKALVSRKKGRPAPLGGSLPGPNWDLPASDALPFYVDYIARQNPRLGQAEATRIAQGIIGFSIKYGVDARLIMAMVLCESGFDPNSTSKSGAMGLGQLMPGTAKGMGVGNAYDSIENLYGTVRLVRGHLEKYHAQTGGDPWRSLILTLAAYNAGSGAVRKHGGVPPYKETQNYVRKVTAAYKRLCGES